MTGTVSIIGGESLIGRELRDLITKAKLSVRIKLIGVDEDAATLTQHGGEAVVITPLDGDNLRGSQLAFLAGSTSSSRKVRALASKLKPSPILIDLTYAEEDEPSARLRAPMVEPPGYDASAGTLHVIAHPASIALALFLTRLRQAHPIRRSTAHVFEPASERGRRGIDELQKQTVNLLSFHNLPKDVFDAQLCFNMLAGYGSEAPEALESVELRIERHLATLLAAWGNVPMPSVRLIQAPVFHGYSISARVEFEEKPNLEVIARALERSGVDLRGPDLEPPSNVGVTGQDGISVGSIVIDRNDALACWFWIVADNFRLMAGNALAAGRALLGIAE